MIEAIPATIEKFETMANSVKVSIETQETITKETAAELYALKGKVG